MLEVNRMQNRCLSIDFSKTFDVVIIKSCITKTHLTKFLYVARAPESVYIMYQPRRRPNIVQSLVGLLFR